MHRTYQPKTRLKGERGYVLIMSALLMLPLLAFAGFAVDIGYWYTHANRMQRAADAAALAGVVWMPNDEKAETIALETAKANGYDDAAANIEVRVTPVGNRRLQVYIHDTDVDMFLSSIFIDQVDIERQALAEYVQAVPMGSPDNTLGNDPDRWNASGYSRPYYWLNVSAPNSTKQNGDRYTAGYCNAYSGCSGTDNLDYSSDGYFFKVTVDTKPTSGDLRVEVFDPAYTVQGNTCDDANLPAAGSTWNTQAAALVAAGTVPSDAATRYVRAPSSGTDPNSQFCVADGAAGASTNDANTSYIVRAPDNTPFDNYDNPVICGKTFGHFDQDVVGLLQSSTVRTPENMTFAQHFRRWTNICTIPWSSVVVGDYLLQITTTADLSNPPTSLTTYDASVSTGGYNKYALRAGWGTNPSASTYATGVNLFADGRLPVYVNQSGGGTLDQLLPGPDRARVRRPAAGAGALRHRRRPVGHDGRDLDHRPAGHDGGAHHVVHLHPGQRAAGHRGQHHLWHHRPDQHDRPGPPPHRPDPPPRRLQLQRGQRLRVLVQDRPDLQPRRSRRTRPPGRPGSGATPCAWWSDARLSPHEDHSACR